MCKLNLQNKRLSAENENLKKQLKEAQEAAKRTQSDLLMQKVRNKQKQGKIKEKAQDLSKQAHLMSTAMQALKTQVDQTQVALEDDEMINMNIQRFSSYLNYFME